MSIDCKPYPNSKPRIVDGHVVRNDDPALASVMNEAYAAGVAAGQAEQLQRDVAAICYYCSDPDDYEPALWMDEELESGDYRHKYKHGRGTAWCQASLIFADWSNHQAALASNSGRQDALKP